MTRAEKVAKRQLRAFKRRGKRLVELADIKSQMRLRDINFREARRFVRTGYMPFRCEMGYGDCEARGYCNGDC